MLIRRPTNAPIKPPNALILDLTTDQQIGFGKARREVSINRPGPNPGYQELTWGRFARPRLPCTLITSVSLNGKSGEECRPGRLRELFPELCGICPDLLPAAYFAVLPERVYNPANAVDIFAVLSEGVSDTCNAAGEKFGIPRTQVLIEENRLKSAQELLATLRRQLKVFSKNSKAADDRTAIPPYRHSDQVQTVKS